MPGRYENYDLTGLYNTSKLLESRSGGEDEISQIFCGTNWRAYESLSIGKFQPCKA